MQKKALLALMLVLTLTLTGCTLIKKDAAVDAATEIVRLGDRVATKAEVTSQVNYQLNYEAYMYSLYGYPYDAEDPENLARIREKVVNSFKKDFIIRDKIAELGLDQLTAEEEAKIAEDAQAEYDDELSYQKGLVEGDDKTDEQKAEEAAAVLEENGFTMEHCTTEARENLLDKKLKDYIIKDVEVTGDEIKAAYDEKVEEAKTSYAEDAGSYCSAANNGSELYYAPAGVRLVKQILIKFTDDDQTAVDAAKDKVSAAEENVTAANNKISAAKEIVDAEDADEESKTAAQADLDAANAELQAAQADLDAANAELDAATKTAYANIDEKADAVIAEVTGGADWDEVMERETQDPGMKQGRKTAETGYAVCADMPSFDPAFTAAAMGLAKIGDISAKTAGSSDGYYIIKYVGDAVEGPIALETVSEGLKSDLLTEKQDELYDTTVQSWIDAGKFKVDMNALKD